MKRWIPILLLMLAACRSNIETTAEVPTSTLTAAPASAPVKSLTPIPTLTEYEPYSIEYLRGRSYGGGQIELAQVMEDKDSFTRYLIRYPSDGLTIYGFANVPKGAGPFPIIILIHGYVERDQYQTLDYSTDSADLLADAGYIVVHPNLRNYPPSDSGDNLFRVGMAIDVLNLIELLKSGAGPAELLDAAARDEIGLWGHSLGGNIVLRALTVSPDVKAAVLYASLSGDESKNAKLMWNITSDPLYQTEMSLAPDILETISPANFYKYITAPVQLYHGAADTVVPYAWAQETCSLLKDAGVQVNCITFPDEDHTFRRRVSDQFYGTMFEFLQRHLSP